LAEELDRSGVRGSRRGFVALESDIGGTSATADASSMGKARAHDVRAHR